MPIRNWGGGGDYSDTFIALQNELMRIHASMQQGSGGSGGGGGRRSGGGGGGSSAMSTDEFTEGELLILNGMANKEANYPDLLAFYRAARARQPRDGSINDIMINRKIELIEAVMEEFGIDIPDTSGKAPTGGILSTAPAPGLVRPDDQLSPDVADAINDQIIWLSVTQDAPYMEVDELLESYHAKSMVEGTVKNLRAALIADVKAWEEHLRDLQNGVGSTDPFTGEYIKPTSENIFSAINQFNQANLSLLGLERSLGSEGDYSGRLHTWKENQRSLVAPLVTRHTLTEDSEGNMVTLRGYINSTFSNMDYIKNTALSSDDPREVLEGMKVYGEMMTDHMGELETMVATLPEGYEVEPWIYDHVTYGKEFGQWLSSLEGKTFEQVMIEFNDIKLRRPENFYLSGSDMDGIIGGNTSKTGDTIGSGIREGLTDVGWSGIGGAIDAEEGMLESSNVLSGTPVVTDATDKYVRVSRFGETGTHVVRASEAAAFLGIEGDINDSAVLSWEVFYVDGHRVVEGVWRAMQPMSPEENTWYFRPTNDGRGEWMTGEYYREVGNDPLKMYQKSLEERKPNWTREAIPVLSGMLMVTDSYGRVRYVDPRTHQVYLQPPINGLPGKIGEFGGADLVNDDGSLIDMSMTNANSYFTMAGRGVTNKEHQHLTEAAIASGMLDPDSLHMINEYGVPLDNPTLGGLGVDDNGQQIELPNDIADMHASYAHDNIGTDDERNEIRRRLNALRSEATNRNAANRARQAAELARLQAESDLQQRLALGDPALIQDPIQRAAIKAGIKIGTPQRPQGIQRGSTRPVGMPPSSRPQPVDQPPIVTPQDVRPTVTPDPVAPVAAPAPQQETAPGRPRGSGGTRII